MWSRQTGNNYIMVPVFPCKNVETGIIPLTYPDRCVILHYVINTDLRQVIKAALIQSGGE